jgi:hypothetical protein
MNAVVLAGGLLIALPLAFNAAFAALAATFDYPDILRRPTHEVLARFREGGTRLVLLWWAFALTAVALAPLAGLLSSVLEDVNEPLRVVAAAVGVLAALVQFLGLIRWPFLVPHLARIAIEPDASSARREAVDVVFQAFNRYLGVAVGEHLGYGLTGLWSVLVGVVFTQTALVPTWLGIAGIVVGVLLMVCSLEFVGRFERTGWKLAGRLTPIAYIAWSLWLIASGVALLV